MLLMVVTLKSKNTQMYSCPAQFLPSVGNRAFICCSCDGEIKSRGKTVHSIYLDVFLDALYFIPAITCKQQPTVMSMRIRPLRHRLDPNGNHFEYQPVLDPVADHLDNESRSCRW